MPIARILHEGRARLAAREQGGGWMLLDHPADDIVGLPPLAEALASATPIDATERLLAPLRPGAIVAAGLNYRDHAAEAGLALPAEPMLFAKLPVSVTGPHDPIAIDPTLTEFVDWEVELAAVIGRRARHVSEASALDHVLGWTVVNDVSARDVQKRDVQWTRGKSMATFCPLGPWLVLREELPDPQALRLRCEVNGEVVQDGTTADMVFSVAELIAFASRSFPLEPGDLLLTGTPAGVGVGMSPPRCLRPGDTVACEIDGIGRIENPVEAVEMAAVAL
jgi:2-keto-4-pentenoate hydratase/2-oxohepta-3-ene-1,7-dioic acid hydratase in catechol pathway